MIGTRWLVCIFHHYENNGENFPVSKMRQSEKIFNIKIYIKFKYNNFYPDKIKKTLLAPF
jgi:hypothetical protein